MRKSILIAMCSAMGPNEKDVESDKDESTPQSDQYDTHDPNNNQRDTGFGTESGGLGG